jgi:hypothetical protein
MAKKQVHSFLPNSMTFGGVNAEWATISVVGTTTITVSSLASNHSGTTYIAGVGVNTTTTDTLTSGNNKVITPVSMDGMVVGKKLLISNTGKGVVSFKDGDFDVSVLKEVGADIVLYQVAGTHTLAASSTITYELQGSLNGYDYFTISDSDVQFTATASTRTTGETQVGTGATTLPMSFSPKVTIANESTDTTSVATLSYAGVQYTLD